MARSAFVMTTTHWLDLHGDWEGQRVEVKEHLGVNDQKKIDGSAFTTLKNVGPDKSREEAEAGVDLGRLFMTQLKTYLVGWEGPSFQDAQGKTIEVTNSAIDMLDPECADEINKQLREWLEARKATNAANPTTTTSSEQRSA